MKVNEREFVEVETVRAAFAAAGAALAVCNESGRIVHANDALLELLGPDAIGRRFVDFESTAPADELAAPVLAQEAHAETRRYDRPDGAPCWAKVAATPLDEPAGWTVVSFDDVTDEIRSSAQLARRALHDELTGLPNRALLIETFKGAVARARRSHARIGVVFVDLDHFKAVNDTCGHEAGDVVLTQVARRLSTVVREGDIVVRLGGDEFVVLLENLGSEMHLARADAEMVANRLVHVMREPFDHEDHRHDLGASAGVAIGDAATAIDTLLRSADSAVYDAKAMGRDTVAVFDDQLWARAMAQTRQHQIRLGRTAMPSTTIEVTHAPVLDYRAEMAGSVARFDVGSGPQCLAEICPRVPRVSVDVSQAIEQAIETATADTLSLVIPPPVFREVALDDVVLAACRRSEFSPTRLRIAASELSLADGTADLIAIRNLHASGARIGVDGFGATSADVRDLRRAIVSFIQVATTDDDDPTNPDHEQHLRPIMTMVDALGVEIAAVDVQSDAEAAAWFALGATTICGPVATP